MLARLTVGLVTQTINDLYFSVTVQVSTSRLAQRSSREWRWGWERR